MSINFRKTFESYIWLLPLAMLVKYKEVICKLNARLAHINPTLGAIESIVIQYAAQMTLDVKVTDEVFAQLKQHFDTTQIVELTAAIATYNMVARFLVALGVSPEA